MVVRRPVPARNAGILSVTKETRKPNASRAVLFALAALCACQKEPAARPPGASGASGHSPTLPERKAGLWAYVSTTNDDAAHAFRGQTCVGAAVVAFRPADQDCDYTPVTRDAEGRIQSGFTCTMRDGRKLTARKTASGDFSTTYTVNSEQDITGSGSPSLNSRITTEEQWSYLGPCPPGAQAY